MPGPPLLSYVVKQLELAVRARLDEIVRPAGLTALQYTALTVLERRPSMTAADLARQSFVRAQSAADLVAALERRGLVERVEDPSHGRRRLIRLTAAGREVLASCAPAVEELEETMLSGLPAADRRALRSSLESCRAALAAQAQAAQAQAED